MCCSIATNWIMIPNGLAAPGITGISMTVEHFTGINYALIYYAITILILVVTYLTLGKRDASNIIILSLLYPMVLWVLSFIDVQIIFEEKLIALGAFGVLYGVGIGIPYRIGFSYGGDDTVAKILKKTILRATEFKKIYYFEEALILLFMTLAFSLDQLAYAFAGQLIYVPHCADSPTTRFAGGHPNENFLASLPNPQTRVYFKLDHGTLFFNDQRKFGFIKAMLSEEVQQDPFVRKLAPEPWDYDLDAWCALLTRRSAPIKAILLNQELIAGLGNIYADEALFAAKIHPQQPANTLSRQQGKRLLQAAGYVMQQAILQGGSTIATYVQADGSRGNYLNKFACVYGRSGEPCVTCGTPICKIRVAGRGTCFCPHCQPLITDDRSTGKESV